ncbi:RNA pol II transcription cofactor [Tilletia horrida]|nr:RNA pol II transcription cofactor [Tilletia horrida]
MSSASQVSRVVTKAVPAIETSEGVGARVRRSIGTPALQNLSPFLMLLTLVTVTLMLDGEVMHEDFASHAGTIGPGDLQWMTAARGIVHAEMPRHFDENGKRLPDPIGLQLWLDLPAANKFDEPDYQELKGSSLPTVTPRDSEPAETEGKNWKIKIIAGESHGAKSPVRSPEAGGCWYFDITLQPGGRVFQPLPKGWNAFLYSISGALKVGKKDKVFDKYHTLVLSNAGDDSEEDGVWLEHASVEGAEAEEARFFLVAGKPLQQTVVSAGPFVLNTREQVMEAFQDFRLGRNGFERAPGWQSKIAAGFGH